MEPHFGLTPSGEERHGFIWVVQRPGATIDVASWLGGMDDVLAVYRLGDFECFRVSHSTSR